MIHSSTKGRDQSQSVFRQSSLTLAVAMALSAPVASEAATFHVDQPFDDGTGLVAGTLSWAILQANTNPGADVIELQTSITLTGVMKRLIDSDVTMTSDGTTRSISGNDQFRPLFVKSGDVTFNRLNLSNGRAQGGGGGTRGGGLGGALFIYDGQVTLENVMIENSVAIGGDSASSPTDNGGGMFGDGVGIGGGGGLFANASTTNGGYGGYGNYQNLDSQFGQGGDYSYYNSGVSGGFGGGGGGSYDENAGHGGFGGGGGSSFYGSGGDGGFGAGGGFGGGTAGFGGQNQFGAGLGGGVFIRSGNLNLNQVTFSNNQAQQLGAGAQGLGGALFVMHTTNNPNGNQQGMPATLPTVTGCGVGFINNSAATDTGAGNNNNDFFDLANGITPDNGLSLSDPCVFPDQEIEVTGNSEIISDGDTTPAIGDFTNMGNALIAGQPLSRSFVISNIGNAPLNLSGSPVVELQNNSGQFSISSQPASVVLNNGESTTFAVTFSPVAAGPDMATVVIQNNDIDEAPFDFSVAAEGFMDSLPWVVTEPADDGTGLVENTLSWAILQANNNPGMDAIELQTDVTITGVMKRLVDSDVTISSDDTRRTISGNDQYRPLFVKSGQVDIMNVTINSGRAQGGSSRTGGYGAGLGGAVFIYDGQVNLTDVEISGSVAVGGSRDQCLAAGVYCEGGGGLFGFGRAGGGGLFESVLSGSSGAYGGYGQYQTNDPMFGQGGQSGNNTAGLPGGFGGGGGLGIYEAGGNGGFGGGGGFAYDYNCASYGGSYCTYTGGLGGFGAGGGGSVSGYNEDPGFGGDEQFAAGLGGGLFIRTGQVSLTDVTFSNNQALLSANQSASSEGLGGGLFVLHTTNNPNGNQQGMPAQLANVTACGIAFVGNQADTDPGAINNNDDLFDSADLITASNGGVITDACLGTDPDIQVLGNGLEIVDGDMTPSPDDDTAMGAVQINGQSVSQTFAITNLGETDLNLTGMPMVDLQNNSGQFSITSQPQAAVIGEDQVVTFDVTFNPTAEGLDTVTVVIQNDDPDEAPYDFLVAAEGLPQAPVLQVLGNGMVIASADETPSVDDNTDFGYTPVTDGGQLTETFELKNVGLATLDLGAVQLFQFNNDFEIVQNFTDSSLDPGESTFVTVGFDPSTAGTSDFTAFEVYDSGFNFLHFHTIAGYGQPTMTINAQNNFLQEGEEAVFDVTLDVPVNDLLDFNWAVSGQVNGLDFVNGVLPSGSGQIGGGANSTSFSFTSLQDGITEGPETFTVTTFAVDPRLNLGFPSISGGVIDDDLIFSDGFNPSGLNQLLAAVNRHGTEGADGPICDASSCVFLNRSVDIDLTADNTPLQVLAWLEETLRLAMPHGDWDGDGLPNHHDLNPLGIPAYLLKTW